MIAIPRASLERLLNPRSIAIVGASPTPGALGNSLLANLERTEFAGAIHLINPVRDQIGPRQCLRSISELPAGVDVAVLAIPRLAVMDSVRSLANRRVGAVIIFSAGFAEGGADGLAEQREIGRLAAESGMVIEGPNCLGMVNFIKNIPLTFIELPLPRSSQGKRVGIVSQSGAMAAVIAVTLIARGLRPSYFISTGNEAAASVEDFVDYLIEDPETHVLALVVEQFRDPRRFQTLARRARDQNKPILLLHPGRSAAARQSAATHTGAMAGDHEVMRVLVSHAGVVCCHDLEEIGDVLELVLRCGPMRKGTAILTESGAFKALTLDVAEEIGLDLPPMTAHSCPQLRAAMPDFVEVSNPVDLTAQALVDPDLYRRTVAALVQDDRIGVVILCIIQTDARTAQLKFPPIISAIAALKSSRPIVFAGVDDGAVVPEEYILALRQLGVPYFPTPDRAFRAVARWIGASSIAESKTHGTRIALDLTQLSGVVPEYRAKSLLGRLGIPFPPGRFVANLDEARASIVDLGWPVVLKAQSPKLSHKSDVGGVILNIADEHALVSACAHLASNLAAHAPDVTIDGLLVERMCEGGVEMIVGGRNDPDWGPVILVGFGGVTSELLKDVRIIPADLAHSTLVSEIQALRSSALLRGFRGSPALDIDALATLIDTVGSVLRGNPRVREIDLNPVVVHAAGRGVQVLDALMLVAPIEVGDLKERIRETS